MAKLDKNSTQNRMSESVIGSEMEIVGTCNGITSGWKTKELLTVATLL